MEKSKIVQEQKYSLINHPLYVDSLFVPTQQLHVKLVNNSPSKHDIQELLVIPCSNDQISLFQIQNSLQQKIPEAHISQAQITHTTQQLQDSKTNMVRKASLRQYKKRLGRRKQSTIHLSYQIQFQQPKIKAKKDVKLSQNRQKYEICLINLLTKSDVFAVPLKWSQSIDVKKYLISNINEWYQSPLTQQDVQFYQLQIELVPAKTVVNFRFKKSFIQTKQKLSQLIFSQDSNAIYIGFDIITNAFKYRRPVKPILTQESTLNMRVLGSKLKANPIKQIFQQKLPQIQRCLVIQFQDRTGIRLDYNQLKEYKIKYLLGILCVPNYDRRGLLVYNQLYLPDQKVSDFQFEYLKGKDSNFVMAIVTSQKKLFMNIVDREQPVKQPKEFMKRFRNCDQFINQNNLFLNAYLNQAIYGPDNNQKRQYVYQAISDYIHKYFIEIQLSQTKFWLKFIKSMVQELKPFPFNKHVVYRIVDYECSAQQGESIEFKNFLVTTKIQQNGFSLKMKMHSKNKKTIFKITSKTGRIISKLSQFMLEQVIFLPYTSFKINKKTRKQNIFQIQMQEEVYEEQQYKSNFLIWVDDKQDEGKKIFKRVKEIQINYPIILLQLNSNSQFLDTLEKQKELFQDKNVRKIIITNMTRPEKNKLNELAGVQTLKIVRSKLKDPTTKVIFYIGNISAAKQKLSKNGFDPNQCKLEIDSLHLIQTLVKLCSWEDVKNSAQQVPQEQKPKEAIIQSKFKGVLAGKGQVYKPPSFKQNPWGDIFSNISG